MEIIHVLAVYRGSPPRLVLEAEDGTLLDLSLAELKEAGHRLGAGARTALLETYQLFTCPAT